MNMANDVYLTQVLPEIIGNELGENAHLSGVLSNSDFKLHILGIIKRKIKVCIKEQSERLVCTTLTLQPFSDWEKIIKNKGIGSTTTLMGHASSWYDVINAIKALEEKKDIPLIFELLDGEYADMDRSDVDRYVRSTGREMAGIPHAVSVISELNGGRNIELKTFKEASLIFPRDISRASTGNYDKEVPEIQIYSDNRGEIINFSNMTYFGVNHSYTIKKVPGGIKTYPTWIATIPKL